ncbi:hypothetical protein SAMN04487995_5687, partial [Dyadobacter koreensis]
AVLYFRIGYGRNIQVDGKNVSGRVQKEKMPRMHKFSQIHLNEY